MTENALKTQEWDDVVEAIQLYSAGLISRRSVIERVGWINDVDEEMRRIEGEESDRYSSEMANKYLRDLMEAAGISTHARPVSPHEVMQAEVIPWVKRAAWGFGYVEALEKRLTPDQIDAAVQEANGGR